MYAVVCSIYREWQKRQELTQLLPIERVWVGQAASPPPFALIEPGGDTIYRRTSHGYLSKGAANILLVAEEPHYLEELARLVCKQLNGWRAALESGDLLLGLSLLGSELRPTEGGLWEKQLRFCAVVFHPLRDHPEQKG
jgi:hypothetical protein